MSEAPMQATAAPVPDADDERPFRWYYFMYAEAEHYQRASSRDEAIALGTKEAQDDGYSSFWICEGRPAPLRDDIFEADLICEHFEDRNEMAWGEDGAEGEVLDEFRNEEEVAHSTEDESVTSTAQ